MQTNTCARERLKNAQYHYAWMVLATPFIGLIVAVAVRSELGISLTSLEQAFGWSRQSIILAVLLFGLAGPFLGRLMGIYGSRCERTGPGPELLLLTPSFVHSNKRTKQSPQQQARKSVSPAISSLAFV